MAKVQEIIRSVCWALVWIFMTVPVCMGDADPVPVATHTVRSARPGDLCSLRRDVVLLNNRNSNESYLQCQRQPGNGTIGIWQKIDCPGGQEFSYSRQRCLFTTLEAIPMADMANLTRPLMSTSAPITLESRNQSKEGYAVTNRIAKAYRKWTTAVPQQMRGRTFLMMRTTLSAVDQVPAQTVMTVESTTVLPVLQTDPPAPPLVTVPLRRIIHPATGTPRRRVIVTTILPTSPETTTLPPTTTTTTTTTPTTTTTTTQSTTPTTTPIPTPEPTMLAFMPWPYGMLGYPCLADLTCTDPNSICISNICHCADGYVVQSDMYQYFCAPMIIPTTQLTPAGIGQSCSNTNGPQCHTQGAQCRQGICKCPKGHIVQDDVCTPSGPKPGESCQEKDEQCTGGATCVQERCICKEGDLVHDGVCVPDERPRPGQSCNVHLGPEFEQCASNSYCAPESGLCTCTEDFVVINWTCAAKWVQVGQPCQSPPQTCIDGTECIDSICQHPPVEHTEAAAMDTGPSCPSGWLLLELEQKRYCAPAMLQLGEMCLSSMQTCTGGSVCRGGQCSCPDDFTPLQNYCIPAPPPVAGQRRALGTTCADSAQCSWAGGVCQDEHCLCPSGTNVMLGSCRPPELPYSVTAGGYCGAVIHCVPGLTCVYGVCVCLPGYGCEGLATLPAPPGASCAYSQRCAEGASCANGWCICTHTDMIVDNGRCVYFNRQISAESTTSIMSPHHEHKAVPSMRTLRPLVPAGSGREEFWPAPVLPGLIPNGVGEYAKATKTKT